MVLSAGGCAASVLRLKKSNFCVAEVMSAQSLVGSVRRRWVVGGSG